MWYLIVSIPDLCTLTYFNYLIISLQVTHFALNITFMSISVQKIILIEYQGGTSFVDLSCFCSVLCLLCLCARLFICALWSPAGKGLTSWLSFVVSTVSLSLSH